MYQKMAEHGNTAKFTAPVQIILLPLDSCMSLVYFVSACIAVSLVPFLNQESVFRACEEKEEGEEKARSLPLPRHISLLPRVRNKCCRCISAFLIVRLLFSYYACSKKKKIHVTNIFSP